VFRSICAITGFTHGFPVAVGTPSSVSRRAMSSSFTPLSAHWKIFRTTLACSASIASSPFLPSFTPR
jgi:hypothetical protein